MRIYDDRYFTERLVRACAELPKMCQFFHIPFQSGSDEILRQMKCASPRLSSIAGCTGGNLTRLEFT